MLKKLLGGLLGGSKGQAEDKLTFEQRRKAARRPCKIPVECRLGRADFSAEIVDMSAGGLRIQVEEPVRLKAKSVLRVTYPDPDGKFAVQTVECVTRWSRVRDSDGTLFAGVEYKDPKALGRSWVKSKMQEVGFRPYNVREQRNDYRASCRLKGTVNLGGTVLPCKVKNIGLGGIFIELLKPIRAGAEVTIKVVGNSDFPDQTFTATVRHQQHPEPASPWGYGLAFKSTSLEQAEIIRQYIQGSRESEWERIESKTPDISDYIIDGPDENVSHDDVDIPSLDSIMEETEPEEEEEEEEES